MPPPSHAKVLIVGGSVAGLALANALEQVGIDYLVLEQWHEIAPDVGASIGIFPNGYRILDQLGCYDAITSLNEGRYAFDVMKMRNEQGKTVFSMDDPSRSYTERLGYEPIFMDRQMLIRILYENLKDKSRVLASIKVSRVEQGSNGVKVETKDGPNYTGEILVGADGIHSAVRREMWRLADDEQPGAFPIREREEVSTEYRCIFGISKTSDKFQAFSAQYIMGEGHSYLVTSAPGNRIYWFLFKRLNKAVRGLYEKIPRYTEAERDAMAEQHANDALGDGLCFGELYRLRIAATLQALPEVVFSKWHYGRIITIGDAAHKFNPISGQGGNSALEDVAVLTNELYNLATDNDKSPNFTDTNITQAFANMQAKRKSRSSMIMKKSHANQSIQAMDSTASKVIARYILPLANKEHGLGALLGMSRSAARLDMLAVPLRPHCDSFHDERPARPLGKRISRWVNLVAFATFSGLMYLATRNLGRGILHTNGGAGVQSQTFASIEPVNRTLNAGVLNLPQLTGRSDVGHILQFLYLLSWLTPILLVMFIEGYRYGTRGSLIAWPAIYGVGMHIFGVATVTPAYCLASILSTSGELYASNIGRHVSDSIARAILPSIFLGYVAPTLFMFVPGFPTSQNLWFMWQYASVSISVLILAFSKSPVLRWRKSSPSLPTELYSSDVPHLFRAYKATFFVSVLYHFIIIAYALCSAPSLMSLLLPSQENSRLRGHKFVVGTLSFRGQELLFSVIAMFLYGLYSLFDLRRKGLITTSEAVPTCSKFLSAQLALGPGAALVGLWWWRERKMLRLSLEERKR